MKLLNKRGISEFIIWLLIGVAVLVVVLISIYFLSGTGISLTDKIKGLIGAG